MKACSVLGLSLLVAGALSSAANATAASLSILVVDREHLESSMPLYAEIDREAAALSATEPKQRDGATLAADLRKSEILTALPEVIAQIAMAEGADLVLDREVARRLGEGGAKDVTAAVQQALEQRFAGRPLEVSS
jgi:Skp family chaperone for outer membrane proteins